MKKTPIFYVFFEKFLILAKSHSTSPFFKSFPIIGRLSGKTSPIFVLNLSAAVSDEVGAHTNVFAVQYMYVTGDFGSARPPPDPSEMIFVLTD